MNDAERFLLLGRQGEDISKLTDDAGRPSGAAGAEALHRLAIDRTSIIPEAVRRELLATVREAGEAGEAPDAAEFIGCGHWVLGLSAAPL